MAGIGYGPMPWLIIGTSAPSDYYGNHAVLGVDIHGSTVPGRHRGRQIDYCWYCCNLCGIYSSFDLYWSSGKYRFIHQHFSLRWTITLVLPCMV